MIKNLKKKKGFTLIELIIVIAILGILAAIAIPRMAGFQDDAKNKAVLSEAKTIASTIAVLSTNGKTFTEDAEPEATAAFTNAEVLGYAGIKSGGTLTLDVTGGAVTTFTWAKQFGSDAFTITYTVSSDSFNTPVKTTETLTVTTPDTSY